jgi:hypothetical protein
VTLAALSTTANFPQAFTHLALISAAYDSTGGFPPVATLAEDL